MESLDMIVKAVLAALGHEPRGEQALAEELWPELKSPWATEPGILDVLIYLERRSLVVRRDAPGGGHIFALTELGVAAAAGRAAGVTA